MATKKTKNSSPARDKITLKAEKREIKGKAVRKMRKEGLLPANIFGKDMDSMSITVNNLDFRHVYSKVKETGVVYVEVDSKSTPCLISGIQKHPVMESLLHVDFKKINLKQKTEAAVPVNFVGESEAVKNKNGVLITQLDHLTVECLPMDIPSQIDIDLESLKEIGDEIKLKDLKPLDKITYIDEPESVVVSVTAHKEEEIEPDTTAESPTIETDEKKEEGDKEESASEEKDRKE